MIEYLGMIVQLKVQYSIWSFGMLFLGGFMLLLSSDRIQPVFLF